MKAAGLADRLWIYRCRGLKGQPRHWHVTTKDQTGTDNVYEV